MRSEPNSSLTLPFATRRAVLSAQGRFPSRHRLRRRHRAAALDLAAAFGREPSGLVSGLRFFGLSFRSLQIVVFPLLMLMVIALVCKNERLTLAGIARKPARGHELARHRGLRHRRCDLRVLNDAPRASGHHRHRDAGLAVSRDRRTERRAVLRQRLRSRRPRSSPIWCSCCSSCRPGYWRSQTACCSAAAVLAGVAGLAYAFDPVFAAHGADPGADGRLQSAGSPRPHIEVNGGVVLMPGAPPVSRQKGSFG